MVHEEMDYAAAATIHQSNYEYGSSDNLAASTSQMKINEHNGRDEEISHGPGTTLKMPYQQSFKADDWSQLAEASLPLKTSNLYLSARREHLGGWNDQPPAAGGRRVSSPSNLLLGHAANSTYGGLAYGPLNSSPLNSPTRMLSSGNSYDEIPGANKQHAHMAGVLPDFDASYERRSKLLTRKLIIVNLISLLVNLILALVAFYFSFANNSSSTTAFAADCLLDLISSAIVLWRYYGELSDVYMHAREQIACIYLGALFELSALGIIIKASSDIASGVDLSEPAPGYDVVYLAAAATIACSILIVFKWNLYQTIRDKSILLDVINTFVSTIFAVTMCLMTVLSNVDSSFWYFDPVLSIVLALFMAGFGLKVIHQNFHVLRPGCSTSPGGSPFAKLPLLKRDEERMGLVGDARKLSASNPGAIGQFETNLNNSVENNRANWQKTDYSSIAFVFIDREQDQMDFSVMETYQVVACPTTELSYTNRAILNPVDPFAQFGHIAVRYPKRNEAFVFSVAVDPGVDRGKIAFNLTGRKWAGLQTNSVIEAAPYKFEPESQCLNTITFFIDFSRRDTAPKDIDFDTDEMAKQFSQQFTNQAFTVGQLFGFVFQFNNRKVVFEMKVKELEAVNIERSNDVGTANVEIGLTTANTIVMFEQGEGSEVRLIGGLTGNVAAPKLFSQNWDFASMGVGGLSDQFNKIFRRAFASRLLPPQFAQAIGEEHVRGILLYGPPGTGKTLIARQIGNMLLAREPKIVNGPEVLNKFVGESEANIRKLFAEAEEEQAKKGVNSGLHMIIFDEIDAICKARGSSAGSSGVGDNVVNQLLSKIDGVNSLHNVLLIGMTNRRDLIDEALLRPGRLEIQIEIGLPNKEGRREILAIHTSKMRASGVLDANVDLDELAECTKNYTGAEIAGLIKAARSMALNRVVKVDSKKDFDREMLDSIKVTKADFYYAMEHDIKPALGASEDKLKQLARPIIQWDPSIGLIQSKLAKMIKRISNIEVEQETPYYALLVGEPCTGLTTVAANAASQTGFPFIRVYQALATAGKSESAKVQYMEKLFEDAARSEMSCIVMDGLEPILDYCHIGPRFSNASKTLFEEHKDRALPKGHRMLVICTCKNEQFLDDLTLRKAFKMTIRIPSLTKPEQVQTVLMQLLETGDSTFTKQQCDEIVQALGSIPFKMGVKELEDLIKDATADHPSERVQSFIERMYAKPQVVVRKSRLDQPFEF